MAAFYKELDGKRVKMSADESVEFRTMQKETVQALNSSWTLDKQELWSRLTGEEAGAIFSVFTSITPADSEKFRLRMIFDASTTFLHSNADHAAIRQIIDETLGEERSMEVFARR